MVEMRKQAKEDLKDYPWRIRAEKIIRGIKEKIGVQPCTRRFRKY